MAVHTGSEGVVKGGTTEVAEVTSFEVSESAKTTDTHAMGDEWEDHLVTFKSWSGTVECHYDPADTGQNAFAIGSVVTFSGYTAGDASGSKYLTGSASVTERTVKAAMEDTVSLSLTLKGKGALSSATVGS